MMKLSTIVNIANNAKTNDQRNVVGVELKKILNGAKGCDPNSHMYAPRMNNLATIEKGKLFNLGSGEYGAVYYGCLDDKCKTKVAVKITDEPSADMEYRIAEKLKGMGVPRMYHFKSCDGRDILYFEYIDGITLQKWMKSNPSIEQYKSIIRQVISNLKKIHEKYPEFRHHDLHWNNIMITRSGKPIMIDFGLAVMKGIRNPEVNSGDFLKSGISRNSNPMYDTHYFLNIIHNHTHSKVIKEFVRSLFKNPDMYLVTNNPHVSKMRLQLTKHTGLPTFDEILDHPFLSGKKGDEMKKFLNAIIKTKKNFVKPIVAQKSNVKNNKKNTGETAIDRAKRILTEAKGKKKIPMRRPVYKSKNNNLLKNLKV